MGFAVGTDVTEFKSFRQIVVDLDCTQLPFSPEYVLDDEVYFRAIESCFSWLFAERYPK